MIGKKIVVLIFLLVLSLSNVSIVAVDIPLQIEETNCLKSSMETISKNTHDFNRSVILAASVKDYVAATPLAAHFQIPLILISNPLQRIQYFIDLYNPYTVYEVGDTVFDAITLTEHDLVIESDDASDDYVVIAKNNDEFSIVGEFLSLYHRGRIIYADALDDPSILEQLQKYNPSYCALVWNPDEFKCHAMVKTNIFFMYSLCQSTMPQFLLNQLALIDDDPYIDVSFGFVTGCDVTDATLLLAREMVYDDLSGDWKNKALFSPGRDDGEHLCEQFQLEFLGRRNQQYNAQVFLDSINEGVKYACFFGHGDPLSILFDTSPNPNDPDATSLISCPHAYQYLVDKGRNCVYLPDNLTFKPTIFIMEACLTGLTGMLYDSMTDQPLMYECDDFRNHSISLKMIRSGAAAYIGSSTIGGVNTVYPYLLGSGYNWSLGDVVTHKNNHFISHSLWISPFPLYIYRYDPRIVLFGDPAFKPSLPVDMTTEDFYEVETTETSLGGVEQTTMVTVKHLKEFIDRSFGKIEITRYSADKYTGLKWLNSFVCKNNIYNMKERVNELMMGHRIEEDQGRIYLSWDVDGHPDIAGNTLKIFVTPERPLFYIVQD